MRGPDLRPDPCCMNRTFKEKIEACLSKSNLWPSRGLLPRNKRLLPSKATYNKKVVQAREGNSQKNWVGLAGLPKPYIIYDQNL